MGNKKESIGEYVDIDTLKEWEHNPRNNELAIAKVARSIERFGFASPVIAREEDNMVIAGHTRIAAARSLGLKTIPVRFMRLNKTEAELLALADNKLGEIAEWDEDMLKSLLEALPEHDLSDIGWNNEELDEIINGANFDIPPEEDNTVNDSDYEDADNLDLERVKIAKDKGVYKVGDQFVICGDCVEIMKTFPENFLSAIVTDPPYGIDFMSSAWDSSVPGSDWAKECFRVLKPGGHLVAFGATRAIHRMVVALEDEGFEIRDQINWLYFSGFPKSMDISKQIDKMKGVEREVVGEKITGSDNKPQNGTMRLTKKVHKNAEGKTVFNITKPATEEAQYWEGWGTALKPAQEPAILCRKPIEKGLNVSENVLKWGTGAINIDACRFGIGDPCWVGPTEITSGGPSIDDIFFPNQKGKKTNYVSRKAGHDLGRWPANIYQCAKPSRSERETGLEDLPQKVSDGYMGAGETRLDGNPNPKRANFHPTVKPTKLMAWLCRLLTPKGGIVLDTFLGSGTTGVSASMEGFKFIGTEMNPEYCDIALQRIKHATGHDIMEVDAITFEVIDD